MRIAKRSFIRSIAFGFVSAFLLPGLTFATVISEATANSKIVVDAPALPIFYDYKGVSVAGAAVYNRPKGDARVSRLPKRPTVHPPFPGDDGNKNPSPQEKRHLEPIAANLRIWTGQSKKSARDTLQKAIKKGLDAIKPGGGNFNEVSKEVFLDDMPLSYMPLKADTNEVKNTPPKLNESAQATATQEKIADFILVGEENPIRLDFDYPKLETKVTTKVKDLNAGDGINPTAVGFAKNRDPFGVTWASSAKRELTVNLEGLALSTTTSAAGASALAFSYMDIILVDGTDNAAETSDELGALYPYTREIFSLDLWLSSIAGVGPSEDLFAFRFDNSVTVSDNYGHSGAVDVVSGFHSLLIDNNYQLLSPYLLTLSFEPTAGVDPLRSVMYVQNYSGAAVAVVPEPSSLALTGLALAAWLSFARRKRKKRQNLEP